MEVKRKMPTTLYDLWHFPVKADQEFDDAPTRKSIGIYSSRANAEAAIERLRKQPGFRDWPEGFRIFEQWLDHDSWVDGYIGFDDA